jgi:hypothetical protein
LLVNRIIRSSTLETPIKQYIEQLGSALKRTISKNVLLQKENAEYRELLRVYKEYKKGKHIAIKRNFVFNIKEVLELIKEAEAKASKRKSKKKQTTKAIISKTKKEKEEDIEDNISESESNYIIVASSRLKSK